MIFFILSVIEKRLHKVTPSWLDNLTTPLISILIILGAVSTAVNMVAAMVKRIYGKEKKTEGSGVHITRKEILAALACCLVDFGIAQFGLLTLIQKAYSFLAYLAIPVILVPYIIHMAATRFDTK